MSKSLAPHASNSIARVNPFGNTPDFQAWQTGSEVVADTWGGYLSRLGEHLKDGSSLEQLLGKLGISREELSDPTVHFGADNPRAYMLYKNNFMVRARDEAKDYFAPEVDRLVSTLDTIQRAYTVKDQEKANQLAGILQKEIKSEQDRVGLFSPESEVDAYRFKLAELGMKRDALKSGVIIPAIEFVNVMTQPNFLYDGPFKSELANVWIKSMAASIDTLHSNYGYVEDMPAAQLTLGKDAFDEMRGGLKYIGSEIEDYVWQRWAEILPAFAPDLRAINALINGVGEK